jgi:hypothetical protein
MPLSAAEAVEYDVASRAVAGWLFPGDLARIQVAIEQVRVSRGRLLVPRGNHIHEFIRWSPYESIAETSLCECLFSRGCERRKRGRGI